MHACKLEFWNSSLWNSTFAFVISRKQQSANFSFSSVQSLWDVADLHALDWDSPMYRYVKESMQSSYSENTRLAEISLCASAVFGLFLVSAHPPSPAELRRYFFAFSNLLSAIICYLQFLSSVFRFGL